MSGDEPNDYCSQIFHIRYLPQFVDLLQYFGSRTPYHESTFMHKVSITNPYEKSSDLAFTDEMKESLVEPYRILRGFGQFTFVGIPKAIAQAISAEITSLTPIPDPTTLLAEIEAIKALGNTAYKNDQTRAANNHWCNAVEKLQLSMTGTPGERLRLAGGSDFVNSIFALEFSCLSNTVLAHLDNIKRLKDDEHHAHMLGKLGAEFFLTLDDAKFSAAKWPKNHGGTWKIGPEQMAKLLYREAMGCRVLGDLELLEQAEWAIGIALEECPGDSVLLEEKKRIEEWRKSV